MLKINLDPQFTADVLITVPGQPEPGTLSLTFKYQTRDELAEFWESMGGKTDAETLMAFCLGWGGIDAEFTAENMEKLLNHYPAAGREIVLEYQRLLLESRIKN